MKKLLHVALLCAMAGTLACDDYSSSNAPSGVGGEAPEGNIPTSGRMDPEDAETLRAQLESLLAEQAGMVPMAESDQGKCEDLCHLSTEICGVAEKLCHIADERPGEDSYQQLCREAKQQCRDARQSCVDCVEMHASPAAASTDTSSESSGESATKTPSEPETAKKTEDE